MACVSRRCAQEGRCNCTHLYDDGTPVSGSGVSDDPYLHESETFECIIDSNGIEVPIDSNRCVTLPQNVSSILLDDGSVLMPDDDGRIQLPAEGISSFKFLDTDLNELIISTGMTVSFMSDGQDTGVITGHTGPTIVGNNIEFPQFRSDRYKGSRTLAFSGDPLVGNKFVAGIGLNRNQTTNFLIAGKIFLRFSDGDSIPDSFQVSVVPYIEDILLPAPNDNIPLAPMSFSEPTLGFSKSEGVPWTRGPRRSYMEIPFSTIYSAQNPANPTGGSLRLIFVNSSTPSAPADVQAGWDYSITAL